MPLTKVLWHEKKEYKHMESAPPAVRPFLLRMNELEVLPKRLSEEERGKPYFLQEEGMVSLSEVMLIGVTAMEL